MYTDEVTRNEFQLPDGFKIASAPTKIDENAVGRCVYFRWEDHGWWFGKVYEMVTSATPRLFKKFNVRIAWADGSKGPTMLDLGKYVESDDALHESWVFLDRSASP